MNKIIDLIARHCSHGVHFSEIGRLVEKTTNIRWQDAEDHSFRYIDLTSVDRRTHKIGHTETITSKTAPSRAQQIVREGDILFGSTRPMLKRYCLVPSEYDGQICSTGYCVLRPKIGLLLPNFLFHLIGENNFYEYVEANQRGAAYPAITDGAVKAFRIPVPPIAAQAAIAKVLDDFTELHSELEAQLEAELESRRKQYSYYRDTLFAFDEQDVRWARMHEVGEFIRGNGLQKSDLRESGVSAIHYGQIHTIYGVWTSETKSYVTKEMALKLRKAQPGDLVIATTSEDDAAVAKAVAWIGENEVAVSGDAYIYRHSLDPKYVSYFFQSEDFQSQKKRFITGTKVRRISGDSLAKIRIPTPPLEVQQEIVKVLDAFKKLEAELEVELKAELEARRKQYEHYRNRLLTFKEAA